MRLLLARSERVGSRLRRSRTIFVAQQKRGALGCADHVSGEPDDRGI
jgi:hypothetical protein